MHQVLWSYSHDLRDQISHTKTREKKEMQQFLIILGHILPVIVFRSWYLNAAAIVILTIPF